MIHVAGLVEAELIRRKEPKREPLKVYLPMVLDAALIVVNAAKKKMNRLNQVVIAENVKHNAIKNCVLKNGKNPVYLRWAQEEASIVTLANRKKKILSMDTVIDVHVNEIKNTACELGGHKMSEPENAHVENLLPHTVITNAANALVKRQEHTWLTILSSVKNAMRDNVQGVTIFMKGLSSYVGNLHARQSRKGYWCENHVKYVEVIKRWRLIILITSILYRFNGCVHNTMQSFIKKLERTNKNA